MRFEFRVARSSQRSDRLAGLPVVVPKAASHSVVQIQE